MKNKLFLLLALAVVSASFLACKPKSLTNAVSGDAAAKAYVAPGQYDQFYNFVSGGFSGQLSVYGLPSGRLLRVIPVFSVDPEKGWGYSEETKPMLTTSHGFVPWDDLHHTELSQTNGEVDGRWVFGNANNTPRVARIDLKTFRTAEIIELPNSAGNHSSPFITENTEYVVAGTRFSVPADNVNGDVPINTYKQNFKGHLSFISVDPEGHMDIAFQIRCPGVNFDLSHAGKGPSHGWFFFSCYNTEQANTLLEVNASQKDKDFIMAVNWKKAEEYVKAGKEQTVLEMKKLLALAYLRLGEQQNCILNHTSSSCIIPIALAGQHTQKEGSTEAMKLYEDVLTQTPDDLTSKYLLTIAAMTLGQYPDGVPKQMRIPDGFFGPKIDFPQFPDISNEMGFTSRGTAGGIAIEDFDNDGDLDILTTEWGFHDQIRLFDNNGQGGFEDVTDRTGLIGFTGGLNINATDYNNDGNMDILVLRGGWFRDQGKIPSSLLRNNGNGTFTDVAVKAGIYSKRPTQTAAWADFDLDGWVDLIVGHESIPEQGTAFNFPTQLYHNQRDGTFKEVTSEAGIDVNGFVKGCFAGDINNDGLPDIMFSILQNNNRLFLNTSDETGLHFKDISSTANIAEPFVSFPTWMFDFNNDGWLDIFVSAYSDGSEDLPGKMLRAYGKKDDPFRPRIYRNNHDMTFTDMSSQMGVVEPAFTMGCNYGDLDNDGYPEFYLSTGEPNLKSIVPNKMYWNREGKSFTDITYAGGFGNIQKGHAVSFADLDKDGDQDMYVVMGGSFEGDIYQDIFFENPMGNKNNWIVLKLEGVTANRAAIGARVDAEIEENGKTRHVHEMVTTGASFGGNSLQLEMGMGLAKEIKSLTVTWQSKKAQPQVFEHIAINSAYHLKEGGQLKTIPYNTVPFAKNAAHHHH